MTVAMTIATSVALLAAGIPRALSAQAVAVGATELRATPGGTVIAELAPGATVTRGSTRDSWTAVTVDGYIDSGLLGGRRDTFTVSVRAPSGANLRATGAPNGRILALLRDGMGVNVVSRQGRWVRIRRTGWVASAALPATGPPAGTGAAAAQSGRATPPSGPPGQRDGAPGQTGGASGQTGGAPGQTGGAVPTGVSTDTVPPGIAGGEPATPGNLTPPGPRDLRTGPDGAVIGELRPGADLTPLARRAGWIRVRVDGWMRDDGLLATDPTRRALSAADLMTDPEGTRGAVVEWVVEVIAFQRADPLRRGLAPDEPYLLARGPGEENALLYLALPPALLATAQSIPSLSSVSIVARVRLGRSSPAGVPILDLQSLTRR